MSRAGEINGTIKPAIPWLEFYNAQSSTADVAPLWNNIMWEFWTGVELVIQTGDFDYRQDAVEGKIKINTSGLYVISLDVGFDSTAASDTIITRMLKNDIEIPGTRSIGTNNGYLQLVSSRTMYLRTGDTLTFQYQCDENSTSFIANGSRIRIEFVPMCGWNNNSGGNVVFRGVRR